VVDIVLADPVRERDRMDAEFDGGLLGLFTGTDERYSASTKLRRIGTGHDYEPSGSGHQLATETGTISVGQVNPVTYSCSSPVVAAFRIATSSRSLRFSAFNRRISACSSLVCPWRSPASISACTTHRRNDSA